MTILTSQEKPRGVLRRALKNAWLLSGGKLMAGLMQLATFALAARGLGLSYFGLFSMLLAQVQIVIELASTASSTGSPSR